MVYVSSGRVRLHSNDGDSKNSALLARIGGSAITFTYYYYKSCYFYCRSGFTYVC